MQCKSIIRNKYYIIHVINKYYSVFNIYKSAYLVYYLLYCELSSNYLGIKQIYSFNKK